MMKLLIVALLCLGTLDAMDDSLISDVINEVFDEITTEVANDDKPNEQDAMRPVELKSTCSCSDHMYNGYGKCIKFSTDVGNIGPICYVNEPTNCKDIRIGSGSGRKYSYEACKNSGCKHDGKLYKVGAKRTIDCGNTCTCDDYGGWACTEKGCPGCYHDGKYFEVGAIRSIDCGNKCTCSTGGSWGCTEKECPEPKGCYHDGEHFEVWATRTIDCGNTCMCFLDGTWGCTERGCLEKIGCKHDGKLYKVGAKRTIDCGNTCTCDGDGYYWACTEKGCPGCYHTDGKYYEVGATRTTDCGNKCTCHKWSGWGCTERECPEGKGCEHDGKRYEVGAEIKQDCGNRCTCGNHGGYGYQWTCTLKGCPDPEPTLPPTLPPKLPATAEAVTATVCKTARGFKCVFPFFHHGREYNACTTDHPTIPNQHLKRPWCAMKIDKRSKRILNIRTDANYCDMSTC